MCSLFNFTDGAAFCHDDTRDGLVKISRMTLHQHYPKMVQDGFEALFSRPPVIYLTSGTYVDIAHYVCVQLGLPLSTIRVIRYGNMGCPFCKGNQLNCWQKLKIHILLSEEIIVFCE